MMTFYTLKGLSTISKWIQCDIYKLYCNYWAVALNVLGLFVRLSGSTERSVNEIISENTGKKHKFPHVVLEEFLRRASNLKLLCHRFQSLAHPFSQLLTRGHHRLISAFSRFCNHSASFYRIRGGSYKCERRLSRVALEK